MSKNKRTRYVPSWGLAFVEKIEMEKLSKLSEEGWILDSFAFLGYKLCKGNNEKLIYNVDYNDLQQAEQEEYFEIFKEGGWTHVCAQGSIHVFSSKPGTQPIYSDTNTMREKYKRAMTPWKISAVVFSLFASASILLQLFFQHDLIIVDMLGGLALVLAVPSLMTYIGLNLRLRRLNKG